MNMNDLKSGEPFFREWYLDQYVGTSKNSSIYRIYRKVDSRIEYQLMKVIGVPGDKEEIYQVNFDEFDNDSAIAYYKELVTDIYREICIIEKIPDKQYIVAYEDHMIFQRGNAVGYDIFLRMELLKKLKECENYDCMTFKDIILLGKNICDALSICSRYHIIHGDIRPDCIYCSDTGLYKLGDFAMNRLTRHSSLTLSEANHQYMSPEVVNQQTYDERADIYSLGMVLYECLNNNQLPDLDRTLSIPINATKELGKVILKACEKDPEKRYQTSEEFKEALTSIGVFLGAYIVEPVGAKVAMKANQYVAATDEDSYMEEKEVESSDLQKQREEEILEEISLTLSRQVQSYDSTYIKDKKEEPIEEKPSKGPWILLFLASVVTIAVIVLLLKSDMSYDTEKEIFLTIAPTQTVNSNGMISTQPELTTTPEVTPEGETSEAQQVESSVATLMLGNQGIKDLGEVKNLEIATTIDLSNNSITDLSLLKNAVVVENLKLGNNAITKITALEEIKTLKVLDLSDNLITETKALSKLRKMEVLILSNNSLTNLKGIDQLKNLTYLYLDGNQIEDVGMLYQLEKLEFLDLSNNPISQEQIEAIIKALPDCIINY